MDEYTTKDIATLFNVSEETVRRWIRSGELKAIKQSNKSGNLVTEFELRNFVTKRPKYRKFMNDEPNVSIEIRAAKEAFEEYWDEHKDEIKEIFRPLAVQFLKDIKERRGAMET